MNDNNKPNDKIQLVYCIKCGWKREIEGAFVNECPNCLQQHQLYFIRGNRDEVYEAYKQNMTTPLYEQHNKQHEITNSCPIGRLY